MLLLLALRLAMFKVMGLSLHHQRGQGVLLGPITVAGHVCRRLQGSQIAQIQPWQAKDWSDLSSTRAISCHLAYNQNSSS